MMQSEKNPFSSDFFVFAFSAAPAGLPFSSGAGGSSIPSTFSGCF